MYSLVQSIAANSIYFKAQSFFLTSIRTFSNNIFNFIFSNLALHMLARSIILKILFPNYICFILLQMTFNKNTQYNNLLNNLACTSWCEDTVLLVFLFLKQCYLTLVLCNLQKIGNKRCGGTNTCSTTKGCIRWLKM